MWRSRALLNHGPFFVDTKPQSLQEFCFFFSFFGMKTRILLDVVKLEGKTVEVQLAHFHPQNSVFNSSLSLISSQSNIDSFYQNSYHHFCLSNNQRNNWEEKLQLNPMVGAFSPKTTQTTTALFNPSSERTSTSHLSLFKVWYWFLSFIDSLFWSTMSLSSLIMGFLCCV